MSLLPCTSHANPTTPFWSTGGGGGGGGSLDANQFVVNTAVTFSGDIFDFIPSSTIQVSLPYDLFPTGERWYEVSFNVYCGETGVEDTTATTCSIVVYNSDPNYTYPASYHQLIVSGGAPFNATSVKARLFVGSDPTSYDVYVDFTNQGQNGGNAGNITHLVYNIDGFSSLCLGPGTVIAPP